jgi:hypothetical protein
MWEELTHLQRVGSGENRSRMSSAFHSVRSRTRWLLVGRLTTTVSLGEKTSKRIPLRFTPLLKLLIATERNHVDTAFNESVRQGRHTSKGPESEEKQCIGESGNTKKQRQDRTPQVFNERLLGDASKYTHPWGRNYRKRKSSAATLVLPCITRVPKSVTRP